MKTLQILYEDTQILAVNKPAGLACQGGAGVARSLDDLLNQQFGQKIYPVHRLDKDTSGILLAAKSAAAAARYGKLLQGDAVKKTYQALCAGAPPKEAASIDLPVAVKGEEKAASTAYRLIAQASPVLGDRELVFSRLELVLGSGRTHQIRVHLAKTGLPIVADDKYGLFALNRSLKRETGVKTLCLAATSLTFPAAAGETVSLTVDLPEHMVSFWAAVCGACP